MIPVMIVLGLVVGRWWIVPVGAGAWAAVIAIGVTHGEATVGVAAAAAGLAALNVAVGVAVHRAVAWVVRRLTRPTVEASSA